MAKENKLSAYQKHDTNPFVEKAIEKVNAKIVRKYQNSTGSSKGAILQAVNEHGEVQGSTSFVRQIEVDEQQFAKIYLSNFSQFFDLNTSGIRVFGYFLAQLKPKQDMVIFFLKDCMEHTNYKTKASVYAGLAQLVESEIIARGPADNLYYINPMVFFNGDRISYTKTYVKKKKVANPNQMLIPLKNN